MTEQDTDQAVWRIDCSGPQAYERYIVPAWMGGFARDLVATARVRPGERVLDVACGAGVVAREAARLAGPTGQVTGLDFDPAMLRAAEGFARAEGLDSIAWRQGEAAALPLPDAAYDVALCQHGLQFFPDRAGALREMRRTLVPGGRLALSVWRAVDRVVIFIPLVEILGGFFGPESVAMVHASCALPDRQALRALLLEAGFRDPHIRLESRVARFPSLEEFLPGYLSVFPLGARIAALPKDDQADLYARMAHALRDFTDDDGLAAPMECHVATARA